MKDIETSVTHWVSSTRALAINFDILTFFFWIFVLRHGNRVVRTTIARRQPPWFNVPIQQIPQCVNNVQNIYTKILVFLLLFPKVGALSVLIQHTKFSTAPPNVNRPRRTRFHFVSGVRFEAPVNLGSKDSSFVGPLTKRTLSGHSTPVRPGFVRLVHCESVVPLLTMWHPFFAVHSGAIHTQSGESIQYMASYIQGEYYNIIDVHSGSSSNKMFMLICLQVQARMKVCNLWCSTISLATVL